MKTMKTKQHRNGRPEGYKPPDVDTKTYNFDQEAYLLNGDPVKSPDLAAEPQAVVCPYCKQPHPSFNGQQPMKHMTYGEMIANALTPVTDDDKKLSAVEKFKKSKLVKKILEGGDVELSPEDIGEIRKSVGNQYNNFQIIYQIYTLCDGNQPVVPQKMDGEEEDDDEEDEKEDELSAVLDNQPEEITT